jgi:hypothetical protein
MGDLLEFLAAVLGEDLAPSTRRGLVATFAATSVVLLSVTMWALMTSPAPLRQPTWALAVFAGSVLVGGTGVFVALLHWARDSSDRWFSIVSAVISCAAVALPVLWMATR